MYSEFEDISYIDMSNSEIFLLEKDTNSIEFGILLRPNLEFSNENQITTSEASEIHCQRVDEDQDHDQDNEKKDNNKGHNTIVSSSAKKPSLGELEAVDDGNDGFKTPTSLEHKIVIQQCPPPPKKPKSLPASTKRKHSSNTHRINVSSNEIEMLFPPAFLSDLHRKIKKVRSANTT